MTGGRWSGKTLKTVATAIQQSLNRPGKEVWVVGSEKTDIYITGELDRTVDTSSLFTATETGKR